MSREMLISEKGKMLLCPTMIEYLLSFINQRSESSEPSVQP